MSLLQDLLSLVAAGTLMVSGTLNTAAPQHDVSGNLFLVNRQWMVTESYIPSDLIQAQVPGQVRRMKAEAAAALEEMFAACKKETGATLISISGYRSWSKQNNIYRRKLRSVKGDVDKANEYVALPGASEHHLGLAMDIAQKGKEHLSFGFGETTGGVWAKENCWRFGFILRYQEAWEGITGYKYEPWHFRYVGKEWSKDIHDSGLPFETWLTGHRLEVLRGMVEAAEGKNSGKDQEP